MIKKLLLIFTAALAVSNATAGGKEEGLVSLMGNLQYFMHKTALSLDARNIELVKFYAHEIEENLEAVESWGNYDDFSIGPMAKEILTPEFEKFEAHVDAKDLNAADRQFNMVIDACNSCHKSTEKGYIRMERVTTNPYPQSFTP